MIRRCFLAAHGVRSAPCDTRSARAPAGRARPPSRPETPAPATPCPARTTSSARPTSGRHGRAWRRSRLRAPGSPPPGPRCSGPRGRGRRASPRPRYVTRRSGASSTTTTGDPSQGRAAPDLTTDDDLAALPGHATTLPVPTVSDTVRRQGQNAPMACQSLHRVDPGLRRARGTGRGSAGRVLPANRGGDGSEQGWHDWPLTACGV